jgi:small GTP-binding protein
MSSGEDKIRTKIKEIEAEYARTQKNKATEGHLGILKAKLSKLRRELLEVSATGKKGGGAGERGFEVSKSGDTRVGLIGFPSVGKSTLLTKLTGTFSLAAGYEFTTLTAIPGTMHYRGAKIQILDLPGIIEGAKDGRGRGRQVLAASLTCNVILIVLDALKPMTHKLIIEKELYGFGIRLNQSPPDIMYKRKEKGPINFQAMVPQSVLTQEIVHSICKEYRIMSADIICRCDATIDQLIDVIEGNRKYIPCIYVLNKIDQLTIEELDIIDQMPHHVPISAAHEWNLEELLETIWEYCKMIRIYTKPKGQIPDYNAPVVLHDSSPSIEDFCNKLHKQLISQFKYAWVWGSSVRHQPQKVRNHMDRFDISSYFFLSFVVWQGAHSW